MSTIRCEALSSACGFTRLTDIPDVRVDLRYATANNFVGQNVYADIDCAWLRTEAAQAIGLCVQWLHTHHPQAQLCILDALRPQRVQERLWNSLAGTGLRQYLADPTQGSIHSFGMAVDVTLVDRANGNEWDMGTAFDEMNSASHPEFEETMAQSGRLRPTHLRHRLALREAMLYAGFKGISTEWWHFDFGDKAWVRAHLPRVL